MDGFVCCLDVYFKLDGFRILTKSNVVIMSGNADLSLPREQVLFHFDKLRVLIRPQNANAGDVVW